MRFLVHLAIRDLARIMLHFHVGVENGGPGPLEREVAAVLFMMLWQNFPQLGRCHCGVKRLHIPLRHPCRPSHRGALGWERGNWADGPTKMRCQKPSRSRTAWSLAPQMLPERGTSTK